MFTNLLIVVAAGLLAPLALGFFPRVRLPAIVLEIVLGIVIGPSGLGWAGQPAASDSGKLSFAGRFPGVYRPVACRVRFGR
jgi:Kef-type K+ transport system membrane component KefB